MLHLTKEVGDGALNDLSGAGFQIWRLVWGFRREQRATRPLIMMQAAIDDSGNGQPPVYVLAAVVSTAAKWAEFNVMWENALKIRPSLDYFKMAEAAGLEGQFASYTAQERDLRLLILSAFVETYIESMAICVVNIDDYRDSVSGKISKSLDHPYLFASQRVMQLVVKQMNQRGIDDQVDFVFDEFNLHYEVTIAWNHWKRGAPSWLRDRLGGAPIWRSEQTFLPLQAADMISWAVRRSISDAHEGVPSEQTKPTKMLPMFTVPTGIEVWDKSNLSGYLAALRAQKGISPEPYENSKMRAKRLKVFSQLFASFPLDDDVK